MGSLILDVDDEQSVLLTRGMVLKFAGYRVLEAGDGAEALKVFAAHEPDLVLLDYRTPGMDGHMVAMEMKRQRPDVPIIMVSACLEEREIVLQTVDAFVEKGDGPHLLMETISRVLAGKTSSSLPVKEMSESVAVSPGIPLVDAQSAL